MLGTIVTRVAVWHHLLFCKGYGFRKNYNETRRYFIVQIYTRRNRFSKIRCETLVILEGTLEGATSTFE